MTFKQLKAISPEMHVRYWIRENCPWMCAKYKTANTVVQDLKSNNYTLLEVFMFIFIKFIHITLVLACSNLNLIVERRKIVFTLLPGGNSYRQPKNGSAIIKGT